MKFTNSIDLIFCLDDSCPSINGQSEANSVERTTTSQTGYNDSLSTIEKSVNQSQQPQQQPILGNSIKNLIWSCKFTLGGLVAEVWSWVSDFGDLTVDTLLIEVLWFDSDFVLDIGVEVLSRKEFPEVIDNKELLLMTFRLGRSTT